VPGEAAWGINQCSLDPTSGSLRKTDVTGTSLREADMTQEASLRGFNRSAQGLAPAWVPPFVPARDPRRRFFSPRCSEGTKPATRARRSFAGLRRGVRPALREAVIVPPPSESRQAALSSPASATGQYWNGSWASLSSLSRLVRCLVSRDKNRHTHRR